MTLHNRNVEPFHNV